MLAGHRRLLKHRQPGQCEPYAETAYAATDLAIKLKDVNDLLQHDAKAVKELLASATSSREAFPTEPSM
jgi:hypothetical protein